MEKVTGKPQEKKKSRASTDGFECHRHFLMSRHLKTELLPKISCRSCDNPGVVECNTCDKDMFCHSCDREHHLVRPVHIRKAYIYGYWQGIGPTDCVECTSANPSLDTDTTLTYDLSKMQAYFQPNFSCANRHREWLAYDISGTPNLVVYTLSGRFDVHSAKFKCKADDCNESVDQNDHVNGVNYGYFPGNMHEEISTAKDNMQCIWLSIDLLDFLSNFRDSKKSAALSGIAETLDQRTKNGGRNGIVDAHILEAGLREYSLMRAKIVL